MQNKIILTFLIAGSGVAMAQQPVDDLVQAVVEHNLDLRLTKTLNITELLESRTENNLQETEIEVGQEWGTKEAGNKFNVSVTQGFDWPGLYRARSKSISALALKQQAQYDAMRRGLEVEVRQLLVDIAAQRQINDLLRQVAAGFDTMLDGAKSQWEKREITILDLNKIRIEAASADIAYAEGVDRLNELQTRMSVLAGDASWSGRIPMPYDIPVAELEIEEVYYLTYLNDSPQLMAMEAEESYLRSMVDIAKMERAPGFSLGYDYEREDGVSFHGFHVGLTLPLFSSRGKVAAAQSALTSHQLQQQIEATNIAKQVKLDYKLAESLKMQMDAYGPAIAINDNLKLLKDAFDKGQLELTHYLSDVNYFLSAQQQYIDIQRRYAHQVIKLNQYRK